VALLADLVHVHSAAAAGFAHESLGIEPRQIAIVPHGNYMPLHPPNREDPAGLRRRLELPEQGRVLLLFGRLGAYKGIPALLEALGTGSARDLHLLIAGKEVDPVEPALATLPADRRHAVTWRPGFVPEAEVPAMFAAADAIVLPYTSILTSGGVLLALSLARPVIVPAHRGLTEILQDGREALIYPPGNSAALAAALDRFARLTATELQAMQAQALATARRYDWRQSGLLLDALFHLLLARPKPLRAPLRTRS
jgi:glycosyltransferase involved in cell wall biosynthesis